MNTSIQVDLVTKETLDHLKKYYHVRSYDGVIRKLFSAKSKSLSGAFADGKKYTMSEILSDLRDKDERI